MTKFVFNGYYGDCDRWKDYTKKPIKWNLTSFSFVDYPHYIVPKTHYSPKMCASLEECMEGLRKKINDHTHPVPTTIVTPAPPASVPPGGAALYPDQREAVFASRKGIKWRPIEQASVQSTLVKVEPMKKPLGSVFYFEYDRGVSRNPCAEIELPSPEIVQITAEFKEKYPHAKGCPMCGADAYRGLEKVYCSNGKCQHYG